MAFPTPPVNPNFPTQQLSIPVWCIDSGGKKIDPQLTQDVEDFGWINQPGQNYGQIPPYQWVNWTQFQIGQWLNYLCGPIGGDSGAIFYLKNGNFDNGVNILSSNAIKFYNASTTTGGYVGLIPPSLGGVIINFTLPNSLPIRNNVPMVSSMAGVLSLSTSIDINLLTVTSGDGSGILEFRTPNTASGAYNFPISLPTIVGSSLISDTSGNMSWKSLGSYHEGYGSASCGSSSNTAIASVVNLPPGYYVLTATVQGPSGSVSGWSMSVTTSPTGSGSTPCVDSLAVTGSTTGTIAGTHLVLASTTTYYLTVNPASTATFIGHITAVEISN